MPLSENEWTILRQIVQGRPGAKVATTILNEANIAAATTTRLANCTARGTHTAVALNLTVLTDAAAHFIANELIGLRIQNTTDGSAGVIIDNTPTTVTVAALVGGATNRWNPGDAYSIIGFALNLTPGQATLALTIKARYAAAALAGIRIHVRTSPTNQARGTHTAVFNALIMTDAAAHFIAGELIGLTIVNGTTGNSGVITANTELTVTVGAIVGGWTNLDTYSIRGADYDVYDWDVWNPTFVADTVLRQTKIYDTDPMYIKVLVENLAAVNVTDVLVIAGV